MRNRFNNVQVRRGSVVLKEIQRPVRLLDGVRAVRYKRNYWPLDSDGSIDIGTNPLTGQIDSLMWQRKAKIVVGNNQQLSHDFLAEGEDVSDEKQIVFEKDGVTEFIMSRAGTRLHNCLRRSISSRTLPFKTLDEYLSLSLEDRIRRLLRIPNLGQHTALEFDRLVSEFSLESFKLNSQSLDKTTGRSFHPPTSPDHHLGGEPPASKDPLHGLNERQKLVLVRRFGLDGKEKETLEAISGCLKVTRERVRQIEKQAIQKLRKPAFRRGLQEYLKVNQQEIETQVFDPQTQTFSTELSGLPRLAAEVVNGSAQTFFEETFSSWGGVFFPRTIDLADVRRASESLAKVYRDWSAPISVEAICDEFDLEKPALSVAVAASPEYREYRCFIVKGYLGARKKRLINVISIGRSNDLGNPFDLWQLKQMYRNNFRSDKCSGRDLRLTLENSSYHFVNLRELGWLNLECLRENPILPLRRAASSDAGRLRDLSAEEPIGNSDGLANLVFRAVQDHGPLRLSELRRVFHARHPDYSEASLLPMLVTFPIFVRLAPGVIGLRSHLDDPRAVSRARTELLRPVDLDLFLYARISGSPTLRYPIWDAAMEHAWANWLLESGEELRLESLLSQVEIDSWSISEKERRWWRDRAERSSSGLCQPPDPGLLNREIGDRELELVLLAASLEGKTHWMHSNQALGWRVDTGRSALALALASLAGWLKPPATWWGTHELTPAGCQVVNEVIGFRKRTGSTFPLTESILEMRPGLQLTGWLLAEDPDALFGCLDRGNRALEMRGEQSLSDREEELDIDALYEQLKRKDIFSEEE